jgi:hypothetical protein
MPFLPRTCRRCGHTVDAHEHYRNGTDCSACDCTRYRRLPIPWRLAGLLARTRR